MIGYDPHTLEGYTCELCGKTLKAGEGERLPDGSVYCKSCLRKAERGKPLSVKADYGHYGGYFVYFPKTDFPRFKALFPRRIFPRSSNVHEGTRYFDGKPYTVVIVKFSEKTKGIKHLEKLDREGKLNMEVTT